MQTTQVGIREAKIHLSKYIKIVQQGNEVVLTDRGRPVGKIVPIQKEDLPLSVRIKKLEERGLLEAQPESRLKMLPAPIPVVDDIAQTFLRQDRNHEQ
ncbi:MAG: type II toxin-antitoxin system prevent-host-death family antitoxin [Proteobacteria bacterium]|nr:type II toxin-antitoxin system prevent-host-death family antitoxin [Pseudomonadota bacterium]